LVEMMTKSVSPMGCEIADGAPKRTRDQHASPLDDAAPRLPIACLHRLGLNDVVQAREDRIGPIAKVHQSCSDLGLKRYHTFPIRLAPDLQTRDAFGKVGGPLGVIWCSRAITHVVSALSHDVGPTKISAVRDRLGRSVVAAVKVKI